MKIGEEFGPHPEFKKLYYLYLWISSIVFFVSVILPTLVIVFLYLPPVNVLIVPVSLFILFLLVVGFTAFWIPKYCKSISYVFTQSEIIAERGVWWKHKSIVPYNRITNIDIVQGPLSRRFGLANIRVQTAGYSATGGGGGRTAEVSILGVKNFEEIKEFLLKLVRRLRPVAVEAEIEATAPEGTANQMLAELRRIREILKSQKNTQSADT